MLSLVIIGQIWANTRKPVKFHSRVASDLLHFSHCVQCLYLSAQVLIKAPYLDIIFPIDCFQRICLALTYHSGVNGSPSTSVRTGFSRLGRETFSRLNRIHLQSLLRTDSVTFGSRFVYHQCFGSFNFDGTWLYLSSPKSSSIFMWLDIPASSSICIFCTA